MPQPSTDLTQRQDGLNCLPNYRSVMDYTHDISTPSFASLEGLIFNPAKVDESLPFGTVGQLAGLVFNAAGPWQTTQDPWRYLATATMIDFDRSGSTTPDSGLRRSWALSAENRDCNAFGFGAIPVSSVATAGAGDLLRFNSRMHGFWISGGYLYTKSAALGAQGNKSCAGSANPGGTVNAPCLTWEKQQVLSFDTFEGLSVAKFGTRIYLALTHSDQHIEVRRYDVNTSTSLLNEVLPPWNLTENASATRKSTRSPELTLLHDSIHAGDLALIYRSELSGQVYLRQYLPGSDSWDAPTLQLEATNATISAGQGPGAFSWPGPDASIASTQRRTLAIFPSTATTPKCRLYVLDPSGTGKWQRITNTTVDALDCQRQPSMALRTRRTTTGIAAAQGIGHLMIAHSGEMPTGQSPKVAFSAVISSSPSPSGFAMVAATAFWQTYWTAFSVKGNLALYSDVTLDNVFALAGMTQDDGKEVVRFYPHGDGAPDFIFGARSDFKVMENETCRFLRTSVLPTDAQAKCGDYAYP